MPEYSRRILTALGSAQRGRRAFYLAAVGALVADQSTKYLIRSLVPDGETITIIPGAFAISPQRNPGAAFGILEGSGALLILISLIAIFAIVKLRKERSRSPLLATSLGLLLGGAAGNLTDRLAFGAVYDFLDLQIWPVFNLADAAITLGAALLVIYWIRIPRDA